MGTIKDRDPERDWLTQSYVDPSTNPYSIDARSEMTGRLAAGTGGSRSVRVVVRGAAVLVLVALAGTIVLAALQLLSRSR
ncbi:hypothetical protein [Micromonospora sp. NPDC126480]|uniref:hypothetical protein n=1 Tax=Micromonospora sp. NPDC126480 TaxID=3155312 RepID=UPI003325DA02